MARTREEVLNVVLAQALNQRGMLSVPEAIETTEGKRSMPDVSVVLGSFSGVRVVLEGRLDESGRVAADLTDVAKRRVEEGVAPLCIAVLYPPDLRTTEFAMLPAALETSRLRVRVVSERDDGDWRETTLSGVVDVLRHSYDLLVREDVVVTAVEHLTSAIDATSAIFVAAPGNAGRLRQLLGIPDDAKPAGQAVLSTAEDSQPD